MLDGTPGLAFRRMNDEAGDTGPFLILLLENEARARRAVRRLQAAGLDTAVRVADYGLHIYFNIPQLVNKVPLSPAGNPWNLSRNRARIRDYSKGACPVSDDLFARAILVPIPSRLDPAQEKAAAGIIKAALA